VGKRPLDRRWPIVVVVGVALLLAVIVDRVADPGAPSLGAQVSGPAIPSADALSRAWYCALGSSAPDGTTDETIKITNLGARKATATVTVMPGGAAAPAVRDVDVAPHSQASVRVADVLATEQPGVLVETFGGPAVVEHEVVGNGDLAVGPCATRPSDSWYFAAGTTAQGTQLWLALFNPFGDDAIVDLSFLTDTGFLAPGDLQGIVVPRRSRVLVPVHNSIQRQASVATQVTTRTGRVVAEQALFRDADPKGLAVSLGAPALASRWWFPVDSAGGSDSVVIANPGAAPATVTVDVHLDGDASLAPKTVVVPSRASVNFDAGARVPAGSGSWIDVDAHGSQVVAEQVITRPPSGLASAAGISTPARRWALAASRIASDSSDVVFAVNPGDRSARVTLHVLSNGRDSTPTPTTTVAPGKRVRFDLAALQVPVDAGLLVDATQPVVVAREDIGATGLTAAPAIPGLMNGGS
jgi:hypothetical protein